ncbi:MAG: hypothetical protein ACOYBY_04695 [Dermatophilaceae bacterium]
MATLATITSPAGQLQLLGSWLVVWDDLLPEYPSAVASADVATVVDALTTSYGGWTRPAGPASRAPTPDD